MQLTMLSGYPDNVGRRHIWCGFGKGPTSYVQVAKPAGGELVGDILQPPRFQFYFDAVFPAMSVNLSGAAPVFGTYIIYGVPVGTGARVQWVLRWTISATGAQVAAGTNLSHEQVQLAGFGGQF